MKFIIVLVAIIGAVIFVERDKPFRIIADKDIQTATKQLLKEKESCMVSLQIPMCKYDDKNVTLTINKRTCESIISGLPCVRYNGVWVAGWYSGKCHSDTHLINIVTFLDGRFINDVLGHELCHFIDVRCNCFAGIHNPVYAPCCWKWVKREGDVESRGFEIKEGVVLDIIIVHTEDSTRSIDSINKDWAVDFYKHMCK